jgi:hypothetical protein
MYKMERASSKFLPSINHQQGIAVGNCNSVGDAYHEPSINLSPTRSELAETNVQTPSRPFSAAPSPKHGSTPRTDAKMLLPRIDSARGQKAHKDSPEKSIASDASSITKRIDRISIQNDYDSIPMRNCLTSTASDPSLIKSMLAGQSSNVDMSLSESKHHSLPKKDHYGGPIQSRSMPHAELTPRTMLLRGDASTATISAGPDYENSPSGHEIRRTSEVDATVTATTNSAAAVASISDNVSNSGNKILPERKLSMLGTIAANGVSAFRRPSISAFSGTSFGAGTDSTKSKTRDDKDKDKGSSVISRRQSTASGAQQGGAVGGNSGHNTVNMAMNMSMGETVSMDPMREQGTNRTGRLVERVRI